MHTCKIEKSNVTNLSLVLTHQSVLESVKSKNCFCRFLFSFSELGENKQSG